MSQYGDTKVDTENLIAQINVKGKLGALRRKNKKIL
jgi:hypothetical protein